MLRCSSCGHTREPPPSVQVTAVALPIASALVLPPHLERIVDFVRAELERDSHCRCGGTFKEDVS